jgi:hypothetical protein
MFKYFFEKYTHTHTPARARARVCVCVDKFQNTFELLLGIFVVYIPNKLILKTMFGTPLYKIFLEKLVVNL